jgi:cell division protease FtsH
MSGADIKQVCKEAGILTLRQGEKTITQRLLQEALTNIRMGLADQQILPDDQCRQATATHEAGHALIRHLLFPDLPIAQISILPRGRALGFVENAGSENYQDKTMELILKEIQVLLAGRAAEELLAGKEKVSNGCSSDLARATDLAVTAISELGMDEEMGLLHIPSLQRALHVDGSGLEIISRVTRRAEHLLREQYDVVIHLLGEDKETLQRMMATILEKETLYEEDIHRLFSEKIQ